MFLKKEVGFKMKKRPNIGLALSSGASRGLAHIGVIKTLEENGIKPDFISGSSIGAMIGAFYCCSIDMDMLIRICKNMRTDIWVDPAVSKKGILAGKKAEEFIRLLTKNKKIEDLELPLRIVATDLVKSKRYVFSSGYIWEAVRASISIPGIFCPVEIDGMILVDGGVIDRVPASLVKDMGSDIVIAVDVTKGEHETIPKNFIEVIMQSLETMENEIAKNCLIDADIYISPVIKDINPLDFTQVDLCIMEGVKATEEALPKIKEIINSFYEFSI
mgnify:CR=1 FL=1